LLVGICRVFAQDDGCDAAPETRRKRRLEVTLNGYFRITEM